MHKGQWKGDIGLEEWLWVNGGRCWIKDLNINNKHKDISLTNQQYCIGFKIHVWAFVLAQSKS